jgi:hypothetical protein
VNRFPSPITCVFVGMVALLVSSCARDYAAPPGRDATLRACNREGQNYTERDWQTLASRHIRELYDQPRSNLIIVRPKVAACYQLEYRQAAGAFAEASVKSDSDNPAAPKTSTVLRLLFFKPRFDMAQWLPSVWALLNQSISRTPLRHVAHKHSRKCQKV